MILITGVIELESEQEFDRVRHFLAARAERSRKDKGNIEYTFSQDVNDPKKIVLTEKWESEAMLNEHLKIPDEEFSSVLANAKIRTANICSYDATNERTLMSR